MPSVSIARSKASGTATSLETRRRAPVSEMSRTVTDNVDLRSLKIIKAPLSVRFLVARRLSELSIFRSCGDRFKLSVAPVSV